MKARGKIESEINIEGVWIGVEATFEAPLKASKQGFTGMQDRVSYEPTVAYAQSLEIVDSFAAGDDGDNVPIRMQKEVDEFIKQKCLEAYVLGNYQEVES